MKNLKELSDEELIELFKKNNYCFENIARNSSLKCSRETIRREFITRGIDYHKILENWKNSIKEGYEKSPKLCKHCENPIPWEKRENEYCCRSCSISENNKGIIRNFSGNVQNLSLGWKPRKRDNISKEDIKNLRESGNSLLIFKADNHNDIIKKYKQYKISEILPGCCIICGSRNCENEFCKKHNFQQLMGFVKHLGFDSTTIGTVKVFDEFERIRSLIYDLYWNQGQSCNELGKRFGYPGNSTITKVFEHLDIPRRTFEESTRVAILKGRLVLPEIVNETGLAKNIQQGWHTTWTGGDVFLRSSYELDYAKYLDENSISYSVENLRIEYFDTQQNKTRVAIPDFYISSTNEIIEIKSDFTLDIQEMLDKFETYKNLGYIPKLILEGKEVDIYNIEEEVDEKRLEKIKHRNLRSIKDSEEIDTDKQN